MTERLDWKGGRVKEREREREREREKRERRERQWRESSQACTEYRHSLNDTVDDTQTHSHLPIMQLLLLKDIVDRVDVGKQEQYHHY